VQNISYYVFELLEWPTNTVFNQGKSSYVFNVGPVTCHTLDYTNPGDTQFIQDFFFTHLRPFQCGSSHDCATRWGPGSQCFFSDVSYTPWRNGDPSVTLTEQNAYGDEGGCAFPFYLGFGFRQLQTFGATCVVGYGAAFGADLTASIMYQSQLMVMVNTTVYPIFNNTNALLQYCQLPFTNDLVCNGKGVLVNDSSSQEFVVQNETVPLCNWLVQNFSTVYTYEPGQDLDVLVYTAQNGNTIVVNTQTNQVWLDGGMVYFESCTPPDLTIAYPTYSCSNQEWQCWNAYSKNGTSTSGTYPYISWTGLQPQPFALSPQWIMQWVPPAVP
jgi:hypothetical protein